MAQILHYSTTRYITLRYVPLRYVTLCYISYTVVILVQWICAVRQYNCARNRKGLKIGTKEAVTIFSKYLIEYELIRTS